jgi:ketosteroid isomerase-like protein
MKKVYLCVLGILLLGACQTKTNYESDIKSFRTDIKAIRSWLDNYMEAVKTADIERILSYHSDNICYLPPNQQQFSGKENLRKWLLAYFNYFTPSERLDLLNLEVFGDFAYLKGKYIINAKIKHSGKEISDNGKFIYFFKRLDNGNWICTQSIWNSDNRSFDLHSLIPADFSGNWKLDLTKSASLPDIISSTLVIIQKGNDVNINRIYEIKDKGPLKSSFNYTIGSETQSKSETGTLTTKSTWDSDKQTLTIIETLLSEKNNKRQEYKRITVYSLTAKGEILNIISDDFLPEGSLTPINERHMEMIYTKL